MYLPMFHLANITIKITQMGCNIMKLIFKTLLYLKIMISLGFTII